MTRRLISGTAQHASLNKTIASWLWKWHHSRKQSLLSILHGCQAVKPMTRGPKVRMFSWRPILIVTFVTGSCHLQLGSSCNVSPNGITGSLSQMVTKAGSESNPPLQLRFRQTRCHPEPTREIGLFLTHTTRDGAEVVDIHHFILGARVAKG